MRFAKPSNKFGGWCCSCHKWVPAEAGFLNGRDEKRGKWSVLCAECERIAREFEGTYQGSNRQSDRRSEHARDDPQSSDQHDESDDESDDEYFDDDDDFDIETEFDRQARERKERDRRYFEDLERRSRSSGFVPSCFHVLGLVPPTTTEEIQGRFRFLVMKTHPDHGGDLSAFIKLKEARDEALQLIKRANR